ncbi:MAG TPA: ABC transporter ATP-binding protein, partial [Vineibacter sp.]|nr:ABC transporter ATP-binding protein [Vineibacter sp.]
MAQPAKLELIALTKRYGSVVAVDAINLVVPAGTYCCLLGPSGCGKTSTLRMIAGHEDASDGDILLGKDNITDLPPARRGTAMMFQNYALFPHLDCVDNVAFSLRMKGVAKAERRARAMDLLRLVQMENYATRLPTQLSGGQQQRVALARALVFNPQLVLMDEPLGALDKRLREQMQLEIKQLHETMGITVVYVTHDQSEALTMSDRIAVFNDGVVQQIDRPDALYEHPVNSFVANFVGENNVLDGTVETSDKDYCRVALAGGGTVTARAVNISGAGASTSLSVRPERISIVSDGASSDRPNRLPA